MIDQSTLDDGQNAVIARHTIITNKKRKNATDSEPIARIQCKYCQVSFVPTASNLAAFNHLKTKHKSLVPEIIEADKKSKPESRSLRKHEDGFESKVLYQKLLMFVVTSEVPFCKVESESFIRLISFLREDFDTKEILNNLVKSLDQMYLEETDSFTQYLQSLKCKFSLTVNIQQTLYSIFLTVNIHYVDEAWNKKHSLLAHKQVDNFEESLADCLIAILEKFKIAHRLSSITLDETCNKTTMMAELEKYYQTIYPELGFSPAKNQIKCFVCAMDNAAEQILKPFTKCLYSKYTSDDNLYNAISKVFRLIREIQFSIEIFDCLRLNAPMDCFTIQNHGLDEYTKWNTKLKMIEATKNLCPALIETANNVLKDEKLAALIPNDAEWKLIDQLIDILLPIRKTMEQISMNGQAGFGIPKSLVDFYKCTTHLKGQLERYSNSDLVYHGIQEAISQLTHTYEQTSPPVNIAVILNPSMKKVVLSRLLCWKDDFIERANTDIHERYESYASKEKPRKVQLNEDETNLELQKQWNELLTNFFSEFDRKYELETFLGEKPKVVPDVLAYWKDNLENFPVLASMARDYLSVQSSSVSPEQLFSNDEESEIFDRERLPGENIEKIQFLKHLWFEE